MSHDGSEPEEMPRIRSIKPEALQHRKVGRLTDREFRLWVGMLTQADDEGRLSADPDYLRVLVFGYHPKVKERDVDAAMDRLVNFGLIRLYEVDGVRYADFPSWQDHQRISHPTPSKYPPFQNLPEDSGIIQNVLASRARADLIGSDLIGEDRRGGAKAPSAHTPPEASSNGFHIPIPILEALGRCPKLGTVERLKTDTRFWQMQVRARGQVDFPRELIEAESWMAANPSKAPKSDFAAFLNRWFKKASEDVS